MVLYLPIFCVRISSLDHFFLHYGRNEIDILFIENDRAFKSFGERHVFELYLAFYVLKRMLRFGQLLQ